MQQHKANNNYIRKAIEATKINDANFLEGLLRDGFDPNQYDNEGWTPLLIASARGHAEVVDILLNNSVIPADTEMSHNISKGLPIHFAGHSGSTKVTDLILAKKPEHLEAVWNINGHTLLLQAVFYGHIELTEYALKKGANTAATTVRGLAAMDFAKQFQNITLEKMIAPYDASREKKDTYFKSLLEKIAPQIPREEKAVQEQADRLFTLIQNGIVNVVKDPSATEKTLREMEDLILNEHVNVNRLAGPLGQPPIVVIVTGTNGDPVNMNLKEYRNKVAELLLQNGADPTINEHHPMGVHAIIRAAVFNHLDILKMMGKKISNESLAHALNEIPIVNGLTALHDTVLRAGMVGSDRLDGYLNQMRWAVEHGARCDIEDFSGRTQKSIAEHTENPEIRKMILRALGITD